MYRCGAKRNRMNLMIVNPDLICRFASRNMLYKITVHGALDCHVFVRRPVTDCCGHSKQGAILKTPRTVRTKRGLALRESRNTTQVTACKIPTKPHSPKLIFTKLTHLKALHCNARQIGLQVWTLGVKITAGHKVVDLHQLAPATPHIWDPPRQNCPDTWLCLGPKGVVDTLITS